jgi:UDP-N-acetylmuramoyl-tripeptide--D-alanyl-D-alanine ligase
MIALTLAEAAEAVGGRLIDPTDSTAGGSAAETVVSGPVVTDARECGPGSLYVARVGEQADGLDYVPQAIDGGAVAVLAARPAPGLPTVLVDDVQRAFGKLAGAVLARLTDLTLVAITGSSGKTSTKDLLAQILGRLGPTVSTDRSYNGEVGVPLTVLRADASTRYLVAEMGARGVGHLAYLTGFARPQIAVVLNVGSAHLGEFGSVEAIARAKGELVEALAPDGLAVLNADDPRVRAMAARTAGRVLLVGRSADADVRALDVRVDADARAAFVLACGDQRADVRLALHGEHHVDNALAAAAVALDLGLALPEVAAALSAAAPASRWRMEVTDRPDGVRVVNDAYNANPESVRAALKALAGMGIGRRTWAVLGEMLELGDQSVAEHDAIGRLAVRLDVSRLVAVGPGARAIHTGAVQEGSWGAESIYLPDVDAAYRLLAEELTTGDVVLLKSSRDAGLRVLGDRLVARPTSEPASELGGGAR